MKILLFLSLFFFSSAAFALGSSYIYWTKPAVQFTGNPDPNAKIDEYRLRITVDGETVPGRVVVGYDTEHVRYNDMLPGLTCIQISSFSVIHGEGMPSPEICKAIIDDPPDGTRPNPPSNFIF